MAMTAAESPPSHATVTGSFSLTFWKKLRAKMPAMVLKNVESSSGRKTSLGFAAPICARYVMMLTGMSVSPLAFRTRNMICESLATSLSLFGFSSCNCDIALRPIGVAALSRPSMFALMFMSMVPTTGCPFGISGKRRLNSGCTIFARMLTAPAFSPIFKMPSQRLRTPVSPRAISKAVFDMSKAPRIVLLKIPVSPKAIHCTMQAMNAPKKKMSQMIFKTIS